jgi:NAD+ diphosphatase
MAAPPKAYYGAFTLQAWSPPAASGKSRTLPIVSSTVPVRATPSGSFAIAYVDGAAAEVAPGATSVPLAAGIEAVDVDAEVGAALFARDGYGVAVEWRAWRELLGRSEPGAEAEAAAEAAIRAASLLQWHRSAAFAGADGAPTTVSSGGLRRKTGGARQRTRSPRVDPVAIVRVESADGRRILLGRQTRFPPGMFSCVAGFVELGESAEAAAVREVREETGVRCGPARLVASQPWPLGRAGGAEIMLACTAAALDEDAETVDVGGGGTDGAGELSEARWFTREEARAMLSRAPGGAEGPSVPPRLAIAHGLIRSWVDEQDR